MAEDYLEVSELKEDNLTIGARGGIIAFLLKISSTILGFLNQVILARILGAGGLGEVLLALSVVNISAQIAKFGMEETMMRFIPFYLGQKDNERLKGTIYFALKLSFLFSIIFVSLIMLFSKFIAVNIFHSEGLSRLLPFAAVIILISVLNGVIGGIMKSFKETVKALLPQFFISPLLRIVIFLYLSIKVSDPLYAIVAFVTGELLALIISITFLRQKTREIKTVNRNSEYKKIISVAYTMIVTGFGVYLFTQADLWIVGMLTSTEKVGIYGVTAKLAALIAFPLGAFSAIIPPLISSMHASGDLDELRRLVRESSRWIFSTAMPIILILILEGNFILKHFFGEKFVSGYTSLLILLIGQVINVGSGLVGYFLQMTGGHKWYMKIIIFFSITNIILNFLLVPRFGINGAALSTAFCLAMINIVSVFVVYKKMSVVTLARGLGFDALLCSAVVLLYFFFRYNSFDAGYHILLFVSLTVYIWKSLVKNDIPWRILLTKYRTG